MPVKKICRCGKLIELNQTACEACKERQAKRQMEYEKSRGTSTQRGYNSKWRKYREGYLKHNPLCVECLKEGIITPATVVDHIVPHKGDSKLFWDKTNHQGLCKHHHDIKTAREDGGFGNYIKPKCK